MKEIETQILINSPAKDVWNVLIDFRKYPLWNPFIISIKGKPEPGSELQVIMKLNGREANFSPIVSVSEKNKRFEWSGSMPLGLFNGHHYFILEEVSPGQTKLIHGEKFSGLLRPLVMKMIGKDTLKSFIIMNNALKERVEA